MAGKGILVIDLCIGDVKRKMSIVLNDPVSTHKNDLPQETYKVLLGWMNDQWAVQARSSLITDSSDNHLKVVVACKEIVASRPVFTSTNPIIEIEDNTLLEAIKMRPETSFITTEITDAGGRWRFALVNLEDVLAFQPIVRVDDLEHRPAQDNIDNEQLYEFCFPSSKPITSDEVTIEPHERGYTITTLDPNIRAVHWNHLPFPEGIPALNFGVQYPTAVSPFQMQLFPFALMRSPNYFQIVRYKDRYFVREGYHRATRFLRLGIHSVPCLFIETPHPGLLGWRPGMIDQELLLGDHPPRLNDFWNDEVSCSLIRPAQRHVYRVSMEEIHVPR